MSLASYIAAVPKVELHVHLEGSIQPATLLELARRHAQELPSDTVEGLRQWFTFRDFDHFVEIYGAVSRCLNRTEDYELISYEFGREMARQNVRYAEVTFSPSFHARRGIPQEVWFSGLLRGRTRAREEFGVEMRWVFDIVRSLRDPADVPYYSDYTSRVAIEGMGGGVVALGLGGLELGHPPGPFAPWFDRARAAGLKSVPHAGETDGPASIRGAIEALGADRIGHGVRAIEDPSVVELLVDRRIPLEISLTSNLRLGIYPGLDLHPFRRLREAGIVTTVNSDDPPMFNTTLTDEVMALADPLGFGLAEIDEILLDAVRHSFLPVEHRAEMETESQTEMARLKSVPLASC